MTSPEDGKKINKIVKVMRDSFNYKHPSKQFGEIEFRQFSFKEFSRINSFDQETTDDRLFAQKLLYGLIVDPNVSFENFQTIHDEELILIIRKVCEKSHDLKTLFGEPRDDQIFSEFRSAVKKYNDKKIDEIAQVLKPMTLSIQKTIANLMPVSHIIQNISSQLSIIQPWVQLSQHLFDGYIRPIRELQESLKKRHLTIETANGILKKYKWFVSLSLPDSFYGAVLEIERLGTSKRKEINHLFIDYFSNNNFSALEEMIAEWKENPFFERRMKIFRTCVKTLQTAKNRVNPSIVVLPPLIAQIDGILNEISVKYDVQKDPITKKWIDAKGNQSTSKKEARKKLVNSLNEYSPVGEYLLLDILFQQAFPGEELAIPTTFSRHKILHGENIHYGRMDNVIRAFLILDFLRYIEGVQ